jgi:sugar phosphate isomerase/epimerase
MMRTSAFTDEIHQPISKAMDFIETYMAPMRDLELRRVAIGDMEPINIASFEGENLRRLKDILEDRGFGVASVSSGFAKYKRKSWDDEEQWKEQQEVLKRSLEVSVALNAPYTRAFGFNRVEGVGIEECIDTIAERLGWAADVAAEADVILALETEGGLYADTGANTRMIIDAVNSRYLKVNYDPGNSHRAGDIVWPDGFRAIRDHLEFMHVKSMRTPTGQKIDYYNIFKEMKEMGFRGFVSNEHHTGGGADASLELHQDILRIFDQVY